MNNRYITTSIRGFVQQIATCYLRHGYRWYVTGTIPDHKTPESIDQKLIEKYEINIGEWKRTWRKKNGLANMQYLRHEQFFVLMATNGKHQFFAEESGQIRDIRKQPLRYGGYSISYRPGGRTRKGERDPRWHAHVQIDRKRYSEMKAWFEEMAIKRKSNWLEECLTKIPFEPYAPIRRQQLNIVRAINRKRKARRMVLVPNSSLRTRRRIVRPFL